jgi:hypothetical protein
MEEVPDKDCRIVVGREKIKEGKREKGEIGFWERKGRGKQNREDRKEIV